MAARSSNDFASWRRATSRACWKQAAASGAGREQCEEDRVDLQEIQMLFCHPLQKGAAIDRCSQEEHDRRI